MWQTFVAFDILYASYTWIQTMLLCRKHDTTMKIRIVSRLWFCRRPSRLKINIRWTLMHFRKSNICANKLDVQETDISLTELNRSWNYFSWCKFTHGRNSRAWPLGLCHWNISIPTKSNEQIQRSGVTRKLVAEHHTPHEKPKSNEARQSGSE